jgi:hypothetical protein
MIADQVEAIVLRTWPIHEADQIVSLFTRDYGKIKGVAKAAARSRRRFGGAMEPMTHVRASYVEKPRQELVRLDSFDIVTSPLSAPIDYGRWRFFPRSSKRRCPTTILTTRFFDCLSPCSATLARAAFGCRSPTLRYGLPGLWDGSRNSPFVCIAERRWLASQPIFIRRLTGSFVRNTGALDRSS